jgi:hypothetical protein
MQQQPGQYSLNPEQAAALLRADSALMVLLVAAKLTARQLPPITAREGRTQRFLGRLFNVRDEHGRLVMDIEIVGRIHPDDGREF